MPSSKGRGGAASPRSGDAALEGEAMMKGLVARPKAAKGGARAGDRVFTFYIVLTAQTGLLRLSVYEPCHACGFRGRALSCHKSRGCSDGGLPGR